MIVLLPETLEFADSYIEGTRRLGGARLAGKSPLTGARECGRSMIEVPVVPKDVPHEIRNRGAGTLRFVAVYALPDVVTRYEHEVQSDATERQTVA